MHGREQEFEEYQVKTNATKMLHNAIREGEDCGNLLMKKFINGVMRGTYQSYEHFYHAHRGDVTDLI